MKDFANKVTFITGGASGIGLAIAQALAARGCRVALLDINAARLEEAKQSFNGVGETVRFYPADVANRSDVAACRARILSDLGAPHLLFNCAGVSLAGTFVETSLEDFDWLMQVNLNGTVNTCKAFLPDLLTQPQAHIVNVSSSFGWVGFPGKSAYCASKFAVRGFTESLRMELRSTGVGVTLLYPGPVDTNLLRDGRAASEVQRQQEMRFLSRRAISASQVAHAILRGVERNAPRVVLSADYRAIELLARLAPNTALMLVGWLGARQINAPDKRGRDSL